MPVHRNYLLSLSRTLAQRSHPTIRTQQRRPENEKQTTPFNSQRRYARVQDVRFLVTHELKKRQQEAILEKYRGKLQSKAKQQGLKDIGELKDVYKERIEKLRKQALVAGVNDGQSARDGAVNAEKPARPFSEPPTPPSSPVLGSSDAVTHQSKSPFPAPPPAPTPTPDKAVDLPPGIKPLSAYLDVAKISTLEPEQIEHLWRLRHSNNALSLSAAIPAKTYEIMTGLAKRHPQFVLPVPREGTGAEIHFMQWGTFGNVNRSSATRLEGAATAAAAVEELGNPDQVLPHTATVLFTHLAEYKIRGEFATPHTTVTMHADLLAEKGLVLAIGEVQDKRGVSVEDAKWLMMCLQRFYGLERQEERSKLLRMFSEGDAGFDIRVLMDEAERIG